MHDAALCTQWHPLRDTGRRRMRRFFAIIIQPHPNGLCCWRCFPPPTFLSRLPPHFPLSLLPVLLSSPLSYFLLPANHLWEQIVRVYHSYLARYSATVGIQVCTALYCTLLYCTALYCTALYCTALYCTALYCTLLHCTALYSSSATVLPADRQPCTYHQRTCPPSRKQWLNGYPWP